MTYLDVATGCSSLDSMEVVPTVAAIRAQAERIRQTEMEKALKRLGGLSAKEMKTIEALRLNPDDSMALLNYAWLLGDEGHTGEARQCYQKIIRQHPVAGVRARLAMLVPPIAGSLDEINEIRKNFRKQV